MFPAGTAAHSHERAVVPSHTGHTGPAYVRT